MKGPLNLLRVLALLLAMPVVAIGQQVSAAAPQSSELSRVMQPSGKASAGEAEVGYARKQVLREAAIALGARAGLVDRSRELIALLQTRASELDERFGFNALVIGESVLPPVISESRDIVAIEPNAMRTAAGVFRIDEPARFAMPTPTWRDWLYLGLDTETVNIPSLGSNGPTNPAERRLWELFVQEGYAAGKAQAQETFDLNLARLERSHAGMVRYYDLWRRGMVSAPVVAKSTEVMVREDGDTISVGNTLRRITQRVDFQPHQEWKPLE